MMRAVIDTVVESTSVKVRGDTNHLHQGVTAIGHLIVIANDLKRRGDGIETPPAMIAVAIIIRIATAVVAAPLHRLDVIPNGVKNHTKNQKSPAIMPLQTSKQQTARCR